MAIFRHPSVSKAYCTDDYDYFEFEVPRNEKNKNTKSYGGVSGVGVWQVQLIRTPEGSLRAKEWILSGVAFYESYESTANNNRLSIKCHGRQSIYKSAVDAAPFKFQLTVLKKPLVVVGC